MKRKSRLAEAFSENFNMVGLAGAAALSAALLNPLPLIAGIVAEAAYLLFVPDSRWYQQRLSVRFDAEIVARREELKKQIFPNLDDGVKHRFTRLETIRQQVGDRPEMAGEHWFREVCRKLDYLLEKFLLFARKEAEFYRYIESVYEEVVGGAVQVSSARNATRRIDEIRERFDEEMHRVERERDGEVSTNTRAILEKRGEVLKQRHDQVGRIGEILTNLTHQMQLLEDSFGLINDQLRARSPEQVLADIDGVVSQTDAMTTLLDDLAQYDQISRSLDM